MNAGVSTSPWAVVMTPRRAPPLVCVTRNPKPGCDIDEGTECTSAGRRRPAGRLAGADRARWRRAADRILTPRRRLRPDSRRAVRGGTRPDARGVSTGAARSVSGARRGGALVGNPAEPQRSAARRSARARCAGGDCGQRAVDVARAGARRGVVLSGRLVRALSAGTRVPWTAALGGARRQEDQNVARAGALT